MSLRGFQEFDHTADWGIRVWAEDVVGLLEISALGMFHLLEVEFGEGDRSEHRMTLPVRSDIESLLVSYLSELLYLSEKHNLAFDKFDLALEDEQLKVTVSGFPIASQTKEIKAVTYHNLEVKEIDDGYETAIVFDV